MIETNKPLRVAVYCRLGNDPDAEKKKSQETKQKIIINERLKELYNLHYKDYSKLFRMRYYDKYKSCL